MATSNQAAHKLAAEMAADATEHLLNVSVAVAAHPADAELRQQLLTTMAALQLILDVEARLLKKAADDIRRGS